MKRFYNLEPAQEWEAETASLSQPLHVWLIPVYLSLMHRAKKIFAQFLILILIGYSGGINIAKHLCDGKVVAKAINSEVHVCKKAKESSSPLTNDPSISKRSCCDTEFSFFQSDDYSQSSVSLDFTVDALFIDYLEITPPIFTVNNSVIPNYVLPPILDKPVYVVYEQYLI